MKYKSKISKNKVNEFLDYLGKNHANRGYYSNLPNNRVGPFNRVGGRVLRN